MYTHYSVAAAMQVSVGISDLCEFHNEISRSREQIRSLGTKLWNALPYRVEAKATSYGLRSDWITREMTNRVHNLSSSAAFSCMLQRFDTTYNGL